MSRHLNLSHHYLGLDARIECAVLPLAGNKGLWTLICVAGMAAAQPSAIKVQGPFHGALAAETRLAEIAEILCIMGYERCAEESAWRLHMQAELRRLNAEGGYPQGHCQFRPES